MRTKNKQILASILSNLSRTGRVLGAETSSIPRLDTNTPITSYVLAYKSYNPYLNLDDFKDLLSREHQRSINFQLLKDRDPKFFQFNDQYYLLFKEPGDLMSFLSYTKFSRIGKVRVKLTPLVADSDEYAKMLKRYYSYAKNLAHIYGNQTLPSMDKLETEVSMPHNIDQSLLMETKSIERKSLLVWNLPKSFNPDEIRDHFWFYDIKHCLELYSGDDLNGDSGTPLTLSYFAFNDPDDCEKFKLNYHGTFFNQDDRHRLLVESLD